MSDKMIKVNAQEFETVMANVKALNKELQDKKDKQKAISQRYQAKRKATRKALEKFYMSWQGKEVVIDGKKVKIA